MEASMGPKQFRLARSKIPAHGICEVNGIIVAIAEQIVIASVEQFWIFAHETPQAGMIGSRTIFVKPKVSVVFASREQGPVAVEGSLAHLVIGTVDRWLAKHIVPVILQDRRLPRGRVVGQIGHAPLMILLVKDRD